MMPVHDISQLPVCVLNNSLLPYCDLKSLVELSKTNRRFCIIVKRNPIWRLATEAYFKGNYDRLYSRIPQNVPFFHIFTAELRLLSVQERCEVIEDLLIAATFISMFDVGLTVINVAAPPACKGLWWLATKTFKFLKSGTPAAGLTIHFGIPGAVGAGIAIAQSINENRDNHDDDQ